MKLARILGRAVEKIYGYGGRGSKYPGIAHMHHFLDELEEWRLKLPSALSIDRSLGPEPPRDLLTLHMAYNQVCTSWKPKLAFLQEALLISFSFRPEGQDTCHAAAHVFSRSAERGSEFPPSFC